MWLELTDSLGKRTVVNMALVLTIKDVDDGHTMLEMAAPHAGALHVVVVREAVEQILGLMEGGTGVRDPLGERLGAGSDFVSDGNEG
jgi:hypothetical protein